MAHPPPPFEERLLYAPRGYGLSHRFKSNRISASKSLFYFISPLNHSVHLLISFISYVILFLSYLEFPFSIKPFDNLHKGFLNQLTMEELKTKVVSDVSEILIDKTTQDLV